MLLPPPLQRRIREAERKRNAEEKGTVQIGVPRLFRKFSGKLRVVYLFQEVNFIISPVTEAIQEKKLL